MTKRDKLIESIASLCEEYKEDVNVDIILKILGGAIIADKVGLQATFQLSSEMQKFAENVLLPQVQNVKNITQKEIDDIIRMN